MKSKPDSPIELHFISSLQLEQSLKLIGDLADAQHEVSITEIDFDVYNFHIDYLPDVSKQSKISGTLRRWNNTETKIDADGEVDLIDRSTENAIMGAFIAGIIGVLITILFVHHWVGVLIIMLLATVGYFTGRIKYQNSNENSPFRVSFRHRDYLLQRIIDVFKSAGDVQAI